MTLESPFEIRQFHMHAQRSPATVDAREGSHKKISQQVRVMGDVSSRPSLFWGQNLEDPMDAVWWHGLLFSRVVQIRLTTLSEAVIVRCSLH